MVATQCPKSEQLESFLLGTLEEDTAEVVHHHAETCPDCQNVMDQLERVEDPFIRDLRGLAVFPRTSTPESPELQAILALVRSEQPDSWDRSALKSDRELLPVDLEVAEQMGSYRIEEKLGAGGMGTVYRARHQRLDKPVALKVIPCQSQHDQGIVARFEREMVAIGQLEHPHLVRAYDAGESEDGRFLYLVMELAEGMDTGDLVSRVGPLSLSNACEILRQTALGLDYIHQRGLVHRDIKPTNIMLAKAEGLEGGREAVVKVLDLGLAKFHHLQEELTLTGQVLGTLDYMSPEQASANQPAESPSDLYSLGCTLFKLLTGRAPFAEESYRHPMQKLHAHQTIPAPLLSQFRSDAPEELEQITARLMSKEPGDRFTASELAIALKPLAEQHNLAELLTRAQHTSETITNASAVHDTAQEPYNDCEAPTTIDPLSASIRAAKPQPKPSGRWPSFRVMAIACSVLVLVGVVAAQLIITIRDKDGKVTAKIEIPDDTQKPTPLPGGGSIEITPKPTAPLPPIKSGDPLGTAAIVNRPAKIADVESWTIETLAPRDGILHAVFQPDGKQVATLGYDGTVRLWDTDTGKLKQAFVSPLGFHPLTGSPLAFSGDGKRLALAAGEVRVWEVNTGRLLMAAQPKDTDANPDAVNVAISSDGKYLASASRKKVRLWDIKTGDQLGIMSVNTASITPILMAFSPTGKRLALYQAGILEVWDYDPKRKLNSQAPKFEPWRGVGFHPELIWAPNGESLAVTEGKEVQIWNADATKLQQSFTPKNVAFHGLAWSADGKQVAIGQDWFDVESGKSAESAPYDETHKWVLARSQNRQPLELLANTLSGRSQGLIVIRESKTGKMRAELPLQHVEHVYTPAWLNEQEVGTCRDFKIWNIITGKQRSFTDEDKRRMVGSSYENKHVASPDGKFYFRTTKQGLLIQRLDHSEPPVVLEQSHELLGGQAGFFSFPLAWSQNGQRIAVECLDEQIRVWDARTGKLLGSPIPEEPRSLAISPDGKTLATLKLSYGDLTLWDALTGKKRKSWTPDSPHGSVLFWLEDSNHLGMQTPSGKTTVWNAENGTIHATPPGIAGRHHRVSPNQRLVMAEPGPAMFRISQLADGRDLGTLVALKEDKFLKVSPNGHYSGSRNVERELIYIVKTAKGQETYTPAEFATKYDWKNNPEQAMIAPTPVR